MNRTISVKTRSQSDFLDITDTVSNIIREAKVTEGICVVYIPHTTCGITINENADPDVRFDMQRELSRMVPWESGYRHLEGNSAAHIKASMMGFSVTIPIIGSKIALGVWQGLYICEFDGPRTRKVIVTIMKDLPGTVV